MTDKRFATRHISRRRNRQGTWLGEALARGWETERLDCQLSGDVEVVFRWDGPLDAQVPPFAEEEEVDD